MRRKKNGELYFWREAAHYYFREETFLVVGDVRFPTFVDATVESTAQTCSVDLDLLFQHRQRLLAIIHTHPFDGAALMSETDERTARALRLALGLDYFVGISNGTVLAFYTVHAKYTAGPIGGIPFQWPTNGVPAPLRWVKGTKE